MQTSRSFALFGLPPFITLGFALCCFGVCPLMDFFDPRDAGAVFVYFTFGAISAAFALLAIFSVVWSLPLWLRLGLSIAVGFALYFCWLVGFMVASVEHGLSFDDEGRQAAATLLCLPIIFMAIQSPLWLVRHLCRWQVALQGPPIPPPLSPLTIRDILIGTGLIGLALAAAQFARQVADEPSSHAEFGMVIGIGLACGFGISLASTIPVVIATLRARNPAWGMLAIAHYTAIALAITFVVVGLVEGRVPQFWDVFGWSISIVTFMGAMATPLLLARGLGFRLRWGRESMVDSVGKLDTEAKSH